MKKKLVLMTSVLMAMSLLSACNTHTHDWGEVVYTWSSDYKTCTAERVCKGDESHKETETVNTTYAVVDPAKCEKDGKGRYTADFTTNEAFIDQTKDIVLSAIGHEWGTPTYTWSDDYSSCTATRVCKNDSNHIESETADSAYTEIIPATCDTDGSAVYDAAFENEVFEVQSHEVTLPAIGHDLTAHDSHAETCTEAGNSAYWSCERCGKFFSDEEGKDEIENNGWIIPAHAHTLTHNSAKAATCYVPGNIEYWTCNECHQYFSDEAGTHPIDQEDVRTPAHHTLTHHEAKAETCTEAGNSAYWSCERCGKFFSDAEGKNEIENGSWIIPAHAHTLTHNSAKAATCYVPGNIEYWVCTECFQYFSDEACTHPIKQEDVRTPAHHTLTHHEAKNATRLEDGNIEYWSCDVCGKYFSDEEGKNEIDAESIIIPALGTDKSYFNGTVWHHGSPGSGYYLYLNYGYFNAYELEYNYYFDDFDYNDTTKELSFIVTQVQKFSSNPSPYGVGDTISFTYNAEKDVLMFGTIELSK